MLRIGGNTVDETTWTPNGVGGTSGQVAPSDVSALAQFVREVRWRIIYGINFATNTPESAAAEAAYAATAFGTYLYRFELGNECDQYANHGLRPPTYDFAQFTAEWERYVSAIRISTPKAPLSGPATAGNPTPWTVSFASSEATEIKLLTQHYYRGDGSSDKSTMSLLLASDPNLTSILRRLQSAATANRISGGYRLAEANSFYGGGAPNVSDAYGSALWAIDFLLINAQNGSAGVNFHGGGVGAYTPIADNDTTVVDIRPLFYGMLFVAQIAPGLMYPVSVSANVEMTAYAVAGNDGATYLAVLNKDASTAVITTIALGAVASSADILVLAGLNLAATTGTTLGDASVNDDGVWTPNAAQPIPVNGSGITINIAASTAVLLKFQ